MELRISIPDEIAVCLPTNGSDISRWLLEMAALEGYKSGSLSADQVRQMLGFQNQAEAQDFLRNHGVCLEFAFEDLAPRAEALEALGKKQEENSDQGVMSRLRKIKISASPEFSMQFDGDFEQAGFTVLKSESK